MTRLLSFFEPETKEVENITKFIENSGALPKQTMTNFLLAGIINVLDLILHEMRKEEMGGTQGGNK